MTKLSATPRHFTADEARASYLARNPIAIGPPGVALYVRRPDG